MTDAALLAPTIDRSARRTATVEIVIPVHNEVAALEPSVRRLHTYLTDRFPLSWQITIADNASTDGTWTLASALVDELDGVQAVHLDQKGRGRALRTAWSASRSPVVTYMDVDLSTDLDALLPLVAPLVSGHSDVAIGSRLASGSRVVRGPRREAISRGYNLLLKMTLRSGFSDAQCGFKAMRTDVARQLLDLVEDQGWFFDTELLVLAERNGFRIHEVPVDWVDDPDSRVDVVTHGHGRPAGHLADGPLLRPRRRVGAVRRGRRRAATRRRPRRAAGPVRVDRRGEHGRVRAPVRRARRAARAGRRRTSWRWVRAPSPTPRPTGGSRSPCEVGAAEAAATPPARPWPLLPLVATLAVLGLLGALGITSVGAQLVALTATNALATLGRFLALRHWVFRRHVDAGARGGTMSSIVPTLGGRALGPADDRRPATTAPADRRGRPEPSSDWQHRHDGEPC